MGKTKLGRIPYAIPVPITLVGALVEGRPNYATIGDCAVMGIRPALVTVSLSETHHTTQGILTHRTFSINFPSTPMLALVAYFGKVSGRDIDKSQYVRSFFGESETAPMIEECPINLECRVLEELTVQHRHLFIGEVIEAHVRTEFVRENEGQRTIAGLDALDPILYALDNRYYRVGPPIGTVYQEGERFATPPSSP